MIESDEIDRREEESKQGNAAEESWLDWTPPGADDSGTWMIMKEMAMFLQKTHVWNPLGDELGGVSPSELAISLYFLFLNKQEEKFDAGYESDRQLTQEPLNLEECQTLNRYMGLTDLVYLETVKEIRMALPETSVLSFYTPAAWGEFLPAHMLILCNHEKDIFKNYNKQVLKSSKKNLRKSSTDMTTLSSTDADEAILVIRGTKDLQDMITDLTGSPIHFDKFGAKHRAHRGIAMASMALYDRLALVLLAMEKAGLKVTITGHSLGASVAAILTWMLRKGLGMKTVKAYCFACPPATDWTMAEECTEFVTSVIYRDDIIPRFKPAAVLSTIRDLKSVNWQDSLRQSFPMFTKIYDKITQEGAKMSQSISDSNLLKAAHWYNQHHPDRQGKKMTQGEQTKKNLEVAAIAAMVKATDHMDNRPASDTDTSTKSHKETEEVEKKEDDKGEKKKEETIEKKEGKQADQKDELELTDDQKNEIEAIFDLYVPGKIAFINRPHRFDAPEMGDGADVHDIGQAEMERRQNMLSDEEDIEEESPMLDEATQRKIRERNERRREAETSWTLSWVPRNVDTLQRIELSSTLVSDHFCVGYINGIYDAMQNRKKVEGKK
eukprot:Clim_evm2s18 gene=Clim_evmTU2s18